MRKLFALLLALYVATPTFAWKGGGFLGSGGGGGSGTGDVTGPAGAVDGEAAVFDGTTGKTLRAAPVRLPSLGTVDIPEGTTEPSTLTGFGRVYSDDVSGELSIKKSSGAVVSLEAGGIGALFHEDEFTPTASQTVFSLTGGSYVGAGGAVVFSINGIRYAEGTHFTISGTTLTWLDSPFTLDASDELVVLYQTQ